MLRTQLMMAAAVLSVTAAAAGAQPSQPSQGWTVGEADGACTISHDLDGDAGARLEVRTYAGSGEYQLRLINRDWQREPRNGDDMVALAFSPGRARVSHYITFAFRREGGEEMYVMPQVPPVFIERIAGSTQAELTVVGEVSTSRLADGAQARQSLLACQRRKLVEWGADPAALARGASPARAVADPGEWVSGYVSGSLTERNFAVVALKIGANGRPQGCTIVDSNPRRYASFLCGRLRSRGRFEPARAADGTPVASVAVFWRDNQFLHRAGDTEYWH